MNFQDPASEIMKEIVFLHDSIFYYLIIIVLSVGWLLSFLIVEYTVKYPTINNDFAYILKNRRRIEENAFEAVALEVAWTFGPTITLVVIAAASFALMFFMDFVNLVTFTVKIIGKQWYWSFEFNDHYSGNVVEYDSNLVPESDLAFGNKRLLTVDNSLVLPCNRSVRLLITSTDVLHSWAVPSLGCKIDAVPGRLNQIEVWANRCGTFYGQCSEICGVSHGFMPIVVKVVPYADFVDWYIEEISGNK